MTPAETPKLSRAVRSELSGSRLVVDTTMVVEVDDDTADTGNEIWKEQ